MALTGGEVGSWLAQWSMKPSERTNSPVPVCAQASTVLMTEREESKTSFISLFAPF